MVPRRSQLFNTFSGRSKSKQSCLWRISMIIVALATVSLLASLLSMHKVAPSKSRQRDPMHIPDESVKIDTGGKKENSVEILKERSKSSSNTKDNVPLSLPVITSFQNIMSNDKKTQIVNAKIVQKEAAFIPKTHNIRTAQKEDSVQSLTTHDSQDTVLLVICANRPEYLKRTLSKVLAYHPHKNYPIVVSEDGYNAEVKRVIDDAMREFNLIEGRSSNPLPFLHIHHDRYGEPAENGYYKLSRHFKYALHRVFSSSADIGLTSVVRRVVILEEDLEIANDFFSFFSGVAPLLDADKTLLCASAWNDNGLEGKVRDTKQVVRSDFFPGLGWMMPERLWAELGSRWPEAYWDDWLREPAQRRNRHTIRPEICRTFHFGVRGVSNAQFGSLLGNIQLNREFTDFSKLDLDYLASDRWDRFYSNQISKSELVSKSKFQDAVNRGIKELRIMYSDFAEYEELAHWAGIMADVKAGVPRGAYKGIVSIYNQGVRLHLVPVDYYSSIRK